MEDFGAIAKPYARALFDIARESGDTDGWSQALQAAAAVVAEPAARTYLGQPERTSEDRAEFLIGVSRDVDTGGKLASDEGRNLLKLLGENDRLLALGQISEQFDALKAESENTIAVTLTSAVAVDASVADTLKSSLEHKLGRTVELTLEVDPALLGGAIVRAEDMVIDGSVRNRLQRLTDALID